MRETTRPPAAVVVLMAALVLAVSTLVAMVKATPGHADFEIHKVDAAAFVPGIDGTIFILAVGSDARPGQTQARGDAIHVIGLNAKAGRATILNIPRDTYINVPGHGVDKINSSFYFGGPELMAKTVGQLVGVPIAFVISTDFVGIKAMTDELGGLDIDVPVAMNDTLSGAVFPAGPRHMNGDEVLAISRNRHLGSGDFTRTENQARVILATLAKFRAEQPGARRVLTYLGVLARHTGLHKVGLVDLYRLGRLALAIDPANIRSVTMPGSAGQAGAASVVFVGPSAPGVFADFADDGLLESH